MRWIALIGFLLAFGATAAEPGKKMYRCGNVFQERPCEGPKPAPSKVEASKQDGPSQAAIESRKRIRCENFERQVIELVGREKIEKSQEILKGWVSQRRVLEDRMKADSC